MTSSTTILSRGAILGEALCLPAPGLPDGTVVQVEAVESAGGSLADSTTEPVVATGRPRWRR